MEAVLTLLGMCLFIDDRVWPQCLTISSGFQPIGSYHRQLSNAARATAT